MTIHIFRQLIIDNLDLAAFLMLGILTCFEHFNAVKNQAIISIENDSATNRIKQSGEAKMNSAIDYFYDKFLSKYVPSFIISIFLPRTKLKAILQAKFDEIYGSAKNKTLLALKK